MSETLPQTQPEFDITQEIGDAESARSFVEGLVQASLAGKREGNLPTGVSATEYSPPSGPGDPYDVPEQVSLQMASGSMRITGKSIELQIPETVNNGNEDSQYKLYGADTTDEGFVMHGAGYIGKGQETPEYRDSAEQRFIALATTAQKMLLGENAEFEGTKLGNLVGNKIENEISPQQANAANGIAKLMSGQR